MRLQQNRIHVRFRLEAASLRLRHLRSSNFAASRARVGIVGHVLRLEGGDATSTRAEPRAARRRYPTLPHVRGRAAHEDRLRPHASPPGAPSAILGFPNPWPSSTLSARGAITQEPASSPTW